MATHATRPESRTTTKAVGFEGLERETGIEPATNGLGSRYSTIELLPLRRKLYPARPVSRVQD
jgi:hypothetical protein